MICSGRSDSLKEEDERPRQGWGDEDPEEQCATKSRTQLIMGQSHQSLSAWPSVSYHPSTGLPLDGSHFRELGGGKKKKKSVSEKKCR